MHNKKTTLYCDCRALAFSVMTPNLLMKKHMGWAFVNIVFCGTVLAANAQSDAPLTWIFLNNGAPEKTKNVPKEELTTMQAKHIGNFGAQFDRGKLLAAGPLGD